MRFTLTTPAQDDRPVYLTGNFCNWALDIDQLQLQPIGNNQYTIELPVDETWPDPIEYKYYRGGEGSIELNALGEARPNRLAPRGEDQLTDFVSIWQWEGASYRPHWLPNYTELSLAYPKTNEPRRIRVLLPADYDASDKHYPVLYLNDGQNIIGPGEGFGSWNVEERMALLASRSHHELIVVAVDHGGPARLTEFTIGKALRRRGKGEQYIAFLADVVKPYVDTHFRTRPEAAHTGVGGSSLGGLISLYAGLLRSDVFGKWLVFSPSLWIAPGIYEQIAQTPLPPYVRVYLYGGEAESATMVNSLRRVHDSLNCPDVDCAITQISVDPIGKHEEWRWSREFARAVDYLFFNYVEEPVPA
ncbi:alpha/beta hydrolase [Fibrella sp. WM1]|uniref:alpha/beta hydrolase n=1 Tax=Fibrella musci TaxID=3242485 RepID=UPI003521E4B6